ncbi:MAG: cytochrome P450 [Hyphomicrobiaceae bacterium]
MIALATILILLGGATFGWYRYFTVRELRSGADTPPLAFIGPERIPLLGVFFRLKNIISRPNELAGDCNEAYGNAFTIRIPFNFDLTYLVSDDAYRWLVRQDPNQVTMGGVMSNVPTVGYWYPRAAKDPASLQKLLLATRTFLASTSLGREKLAEVPAIIATELDRQAHTLESGPVDLSTTLWPIVFNASGRAIVGDDLWQRIGSEVAPLYRNIADGIDITRTTLSVTPLAPFTKEYRSTRKLRHIIDRVINEHRNGKPNDFIAAIERIQIDGAPILEADVGWMLMYVLWNALVYPGSYAFWSLVDVVSHPEVHKRVAEASPARTGDIATQPEANAAPSRQEILRDCFVETLRLHPIGSLVRAPMEALEYRDGEKIWHLPPGGYVGVLPYRLMRDPAAFGNPNGYDPLRYSEGREDAPGLFGHGAFGCVAERYSKLLLVAFMDEMLARYDIELAGPLPDRHNRVHLTYPYSELPARLTRTDELVPRAA